MVEAVATCCSSLIDYIQEKGKKKAMFLFVSQHYSAVQNFLLFAIFCRSLWHALVVQQNSGSEQKANALRSSGGHQHAQLLSPSTRRPSCSSSLLRRGQPVATESW